MAVKPEDKAIELAGIKTAVVTMKGIAQEIELSGEIGYNENQTAHLYLTRYQTLQIRTR